MNLLFDKIQAILKAQKVSQAEFSRKIQVTPQRYSKWLHGTGEPGPASLLRMARVLNVTLESLVDDAMEPVPALDKDDQELIRMVREHGGLDTLLRRAGEFHAQQASADVSNSR